MRGIPFTHIHETVTRQRVVAAIADEITRATAKSGFGSWLAAQIMPERAPRGLMIAGNWPDDWLRRYSAGRIKGLDFLFAQTGKRGMATWGYDQPWTDPFELLEQPNGLALWSVDQKGQSGVLIVSGGQRKSLNALERSRISAAGTLVIRSLLAATEDYIDGASAITPQEIDVLQCIAEGMTSTEAADALRLTTTTVNSYVQDICRKLSARSRVHAVAEAIRLQLIS